MEVYTKQLNTPPPTYIVLKCVIYGIPTVILLIKFIFIQQADLFLFRQPRCLPLIISELARQPSIK